MLVLLSPAGGAGGAVGAVLLKGGGGGALEPNFSFSFSFGCGGPEVFAEVDALASVPRDKICRGAGGTSPASEGAREV